MPEVIEARRLALSSLVKNSTTEPASAAILTTPNKEAGAKSDIKFEKQTSQAEPSILNGSNNNGPSTGGKTVDTDAANNSNRIIALSPPLNAAPATTGQYASPLPLGNPPLHHLPNGANNNNTSNHRAISPYMTSEHGANAAAITPSKSLSSTATSTSSNPYNNGASPAYFMNPNTYNQNLAPVSTFY